jgi:hypothetical protein
MLERLAKKWNRILRFGAIPSKSGIHGSVVRAWTLATIIAQGLSKGSGFGLCLGVTASLDLETPDRIGAIYRKGVGSI